MTRNEMLQDLAYARSLAEEGRHAPLIGGSYLVLFGVLLAVCYSAQWSILAGLTPFTPPMVGLIWMGFGAAASIGVALLSRRVRALPGGASIPNRVDRNVWQAVAIAILVVVIATVLRAVLRDDYLAANAIVASGFGLYGVALYATATVGGHAWLRTFALMAWVASGVLWYFIDAPWLYLFAAAASIIVLIVPGVVMMRREPNAVV